MRPRSTSFSHTLTWLSPPSLLSSGDRLQDNNDVQPRPSTTVTRLLVLFSASLNSLLSNHQLTSSSKNEKCAFPSSLFSCAQQFQVSTTWESVWYMLIGSLCDADRAAVPFAYGNVWFVPMACHHLVD